MSISGAFGGIVVAIFLLVLGILLVTGILDFLLRILGAICIVVGVIVGAMALFGKKNTYRY
jgi:hypothetical protein